MAAIAEQGQCVATDGAVVGRPQPAIGGIFDARVLRGRGPALPAAAGLRPSAGSSGSKPPRNGMLLPASVQPMCPALSATSRFCGGMPICGRQVQRAGHVRRALQLHQAEVVAARQRADPASASGVPSVSVAMIGPQRVSATRQHRVGPALDLDVLGRMRTRSQPSGAL